MTYPTSNRVTGTATAIPSEQDVLGALITGDASLADLPHFSADWFFDPIHADIFNAIEGQAGAHEPITIAALADILGPDPEADSEAGALGVLHDVGGPAYLVDLAARAPAPIAESSHAVLCAWLWRQILAGDAQ